MMPVPMMLSVAGSGHEISTLPRCIKNCAGRQGSVPSFNASMNVNGFDNPLLSAISILSDL
jgi:hypothetical protein